MNREYKNLRDLYMEKINLGTLKKQSNGCYKVQKKFYDVDKPIYVEGRDADEIAHKLILKRDEAKINKLRVDDNGECFYKVAQEWFKVKVENKGLADKYVRDIMGILNNHIIPEFRDKGIKSIKDKDLQMYLNNKATEYTETTVKKHKNYIERIFGYAVANRYLSVAPTYALELPKCVSSKNEKNLPVTEEELTLAIKATKDDEDMQLILHMSYIYGMRPCEISNLTWKNFNFSEGWFRIEKSKYSDAITTKNEDAVKRYLPLTPALIETLLKHKERHNQMGFNDDALFHKRSSKKQLTSDALDDYFVTLTRQMEIANGAKLYNNRIVEDTGVRHFTPYAFRKGVVTRMNAANFNDSITQCFVGHSPKEVKDRYYSKMNFVQHLRPHYESFVTKSELTVMKCMEKAGVGLL